MRHMQTFIDGLIFTLAFILIPAASLLADPPGGEDILYPGSAPAAAPAIGSPFLQIDAGLTQSSLQSNEGFHAPDPAFDGVPGYLKSSNGTAPNLGLTLGYRVAPAFSFGVRFEYDSRHAGNSGLVKVPCNEYDPETGEVVNQRLVDVEDRYSATVNYLTISALPAVHVENFFFYAGPSIGIPISRSINETATLLDTTGNCQFFFGTEDSATSITGSLGGDGNLKERLGVKLGLGYIHPITSSVGLVLQAGADVGSSDLFEADEDIVLANPRTHGGSSTSYTINSSLRFHSLQGSIGLRINL